MNKYLNGDPLPWLTDSEDPAVTYLANREFNTEKDPDALYSDLASSPLADYLKKNSAGNILGDKKNYDLFYRGSVWFFLLAAESGYDLRSDFMKATADYICSVSQQPDGGFSFNWRPPLPVGCRTGNMISAMLKSGIDDDRTASGLSWIIKNQRSDGGWLHCPFRGACDVMKLVVFNRPGGGRHDDPDDAVPSCPVATCSCMAALVESRKSDYAAHLSSAAGFLLSIDLSMENKKSKTRCGLFTDPLKPGYPVMSQFDIISLLRLVTVTGMWNSSRGGELFNYIMRLQGSSGRWRSMNHEQGMISEKKGESRWVTLNALRLIKAVTEREALVGESVTS